MEQAAQSQVGGRYRMALFDVSLGWDASRAAKAERSRWRSRRWVMTHDTCVFRLHLFG